MWLLLCYPPTHSSVRFSVLQLLCDRQHADLCKADLTACVFASRNTTLCFMPFVAFAAEISCEVTHWKPHNP